MSFTVATVDGGPVRPNPADDGLMSESYIYTNTGGSTGGTITSKLLTKLLEVKGAYLNYSISGLTATIATDANAKGVVTLIGRG